MKLQAQVAVIGAGAAGLAAAQRLHARNLDVVVLEARDRVGGRAHTLQTRDRLWPIELGAEFIHGRPPSTLALLEASGERALAAADHMFQIRNGCLEPATDLWETTERVLQRVDLAAPDRSVDEFLAALHGDISAEALEGVRSLIEGFDATLGADASAIGIAKEWRSGTNDTLGRPANGYRPVMEHLARTLPGRIHLQTRVEEVAWSTRGVRIRARRAGEPLEVRARRAVVTLPIGVLRAQRVRFAPALPAGKLAAVAAIAMGPVVRVVLEFAAPFWEGVDGGRFRDAAFFYAPSGEGFRSLWTRLPQRTPLLVAWAGGGAAARLIERRVDPIAAALTTAAQLFPGVAVREQLRNAHFHDWQADPFAGGAYSYLRVGGGDARHALGVPVEQTLFFAGEATASDDPGTIAGSFESGYRAAREIMVLPADAAAR